MEEKKENEIILSSQEYFDKLKDKKNNITEEELKKIYDNCIELANKYRITGQVRGLKKILFCIESIEKEIVLVKKGITTFIYRDDIDFYIDNIAAKDIIRPVKIIELERYEREIPDDIVEVIAQTKNIFDKLYVVYTDYTGKEERKVEKEKQQKDPILFGTFQNKDYQVCIDRFYYLGDWVDEYCDLTLDKMVNETSKLGRNIVRTLKVPYTIQDLKDYIDTYESKEIKKSWGIFRSYHKKADKDIAKEKKGNIFTQIKTIFTPK